MDLRLLGPVEAYVDGRRVPLGPPKQRALLAILALDAGHTVAADRLVDGLWGDEPPASAPKMVQLYVSQLRRLMSGNGAEIIRNGRGYELRLTDGDLDVARFSRLVEGGRAREALSLWRGVALADLADEPFAVTEIPRLDELRLRATERAIDLDLAAGRHTEVIAELEGLAAAQPFRERLHAQRMLALYRAGRQSEALAAYREARTVLVEQIGVEPGAELQRLQRAILEHDPALDFPPASTREPSRTPVSDRSHRRRFALIAVAGAASIALLAVFAIMRATQPEGLARIDENAVGLVDGKSGRITTQYAVGRGPTALAAGAGSVWVANSQDGTVARLIPGGEQVVTIDVGGEPAGLAFGAGSLWVTDGSGRTVAQIDPRVNRVVQRFEVGNSANAVAVGDGAVWVTSAVDGTVARIDLRRGEVTNRIAVGARPTAIAAGAGAVWVGSDVDPSVVRVAPRTQTVVARIPTGNAPSSIAVGAGAVWVANRMDDNVSRVDPATDRVTDTVRVGREPRAVIAGDDGVWVANAGDGTLVQLDPRTPRVLRRVKLGSSPVALATANGAVWSAQVAAASTHRGGRLRVSTSASLDGEPDRFDPVTLNRLASLVYDGLVGYRRAGGSAGGALVPQLARELPEPSADGLTYVFRLRPHLRFSNGKAVTPGDVRASVERTIALTRELGGGADYLPIRGATRCSVGGCDLSRAIETDDVARTVTIHLARPDAGFLHKLSNAFVVPASSPLELARRPLPGTGPYRVERWDRYGNGLFVRNRYFRVLSPDRPDGFPDEIAVQSAGPRAQLAAVERGKSDIALLSYGTEQVAHARGRYGTRLHSDSSAETWYVFLNTRVPPFDDPRVRRALNYAVDRSRVAAILGSQETEKPTCQMLPPGFQGYAPFCPFTVRASPSGVWSAPDLAKARTLVAESGTRGMKVEFWGSQPWEPLGGYFRALLGRLGYRSSVRTFDDLHLIMDAGSRARGERPQVGLWGWTADSAGPLNFLTPLISCAGSVNLSGFCDRKIDTAMQEAGLAHGLDAIEKWRRVATAVAAQSPTVPLVNEDSISLTAERVGNYQYHPLWGPLLEQMWVK